MPKIINLKGLFSGTGFETKKGRRLEKSDVGFLANPKELCWNLDTGKITAQSPDTIVYDGSGLVATSGWVDSHTHAIFEGTRYAEFFQRWEGLDYATIASRGGGIHNTVKETLSKDADSLIDTLIEKLNRFVQSGTTFLEIKSGYANTAGAELFLLRTLKQARSRLLAHHPRYKTTFLALHALPKGKSESSYVLEMTEALKTVANEGLAEFVDAFPEEGFFGLGPSLEFVKQAQALGLKAKIHADEITDMKAAEYFVSNGAVSVDHLQKVNSTGMDFLGQYPTVATLLPATSFFLGLPYANARELISRGAQVALSTDYNPGTAPELSFSFTQKLAASCLKMSPHEILGASTYNGAAALCVESERGQIREGFFADILLFAPTVASAGESGERYLEELLIDSTRLKSVFCQGAKAFSKF